MEEFEFVSENESGGDGDVKYLALQDRFLTRKRLHFHRKTFVCLLSGCFAVIFLIALIVLAFTFCAPNPESKKIIAESTSTEGSITENVSETTSLSSIQTETIQMTTTMTSTVTTQVITTTLTTTTTTTTTEIPFIKKMILATNISVKYLKSNGMHSIYQRFYSIGTSSKDLSFLLNQSCSRSDSILCVGGGKVQDDHTAEIFIDLISCGNCSLIAEITPINRPNLVNGAYWYFTAGLSFGFSPIYKITQNNYDTFNSTRDEKRLSWKIDAPIGRGGGRLGTLKLENSKKYYKYIFTN